jgi:uncharacterized protein (TIGR02757 family)
MLPELKDFFEEMMIKYYSFDFIINDPISIPHQYKIKEDIEISGFLTAILSWGQRRMIIKKSVELMERMDNQPYEFITQSGKHDLKSIQGFNYRTFNETDCLTIINSLKMIYVNDGGLEKVFTDGFHSDGAFGAIVNAYQKIFSYPHISRTRKHIANPMAGSAAKRLNMYLRWMVRDNEKEVDFGIWKQISPSQLICPLDVHSGNTARKLGLLTRPANDWKAANELTANLRIFDSNDPIKYDFVLFGLGIDGYFKG